MQSKTKVVRSNILWNCLNFCKSKCTFDSGTNGRIQSSFLDEINLFHVSLRRQEARSILVSCLVWKFPRTRMSYDLVQTTLRTTEFRQTNTKGRIRCRRLPALCRV